MDYKTQQWRPYTQKLLVFWDLLECQDERIRMEHNLLLGISENITREIMSIGQVGKKIPHE